MRPSLNVLDRGLIERILDETRRILSETGMEIRGEALRRRLLDHGLRTDGGGDRILFPADVVDKAVETAPSSFTLFDRDGKAHAEIGGWNVNFVPGSSGLKILDHRSGETRLAHSADFVEYVRLADGLEHLGYLATAFSTNRDIEPQVSDAWRLYMVLVNSKRPVVSGAFSEHGVPRMVRLLRMFRRDADELAARPMSVFTITATGNFRYGEDSCQNLLDCVEAGIPIEIVPVTLMGLIAPVTLVGALVFHCVDVLAGLTMAQILRPGHPVLFGGAPATFHMKAASSPMAAIEAQHLDVAYAAIARHLGLPSQAYMALSDGKDLDAQAGGETFSSALLAALAGVNSVAPAQAGVRQRGLRPGPPLLPGDPAAGRPAQPAPGGSPDEGWPPDHRAPDARALATGTLPDRSGHRPGDARHRGPERRPGSRRAGLCGGRAAPRRLSAGRDRSRDRRSAACRDTGRHGVAGPSARPAAAPGRPGQRRQGPPPRAPAGPIAAVSCGEVGITHPREFVGSLARVRRFGTGVLASACNCLRSWSVRQLV
jgi:trimethylamine--corrinoid protein Co-methyltransferase